MRDIIPIGIQEAIRAGCRDKLDNFGYGIGFTNTCTLDVDPALLQSTAETLQHDADVAKALRSQYSSVYSSVQNSRATSKQIEDALVTLGTADTTDEAAGK